MKRIKIYVVLCMLLLCAATPEVNLFDWIGSDELRKVAEVLRYSPEINEIGVNTVIRILADPTKVSCLSFVL